MPNVVAGIAELWKLEFPKLMKLNNGRYNLRIMLTFMSRFFLLNYLTGCVKKQNRQLIINVLIAVKMLLTGK